MDNLHYSKNENTSSERNMHFLHVLNSILPVWYSSKDDPQSGQTDGNLILKTIEILI